MALEINEFLKLSTAALSADPKAPVAYSYGNEQYSAAQLEEALRNEFKEIAGTPMQFEKNKHLVFELISRTIDEVLPKRIDDVYMQFADVQTVAQGQKAVYKQRITEFAKKRAKSFVTRVGLAGRYEVFMLDGREYTVQTGAIGGAARIGYEEYLDGRWTFADFTTLLMEGMDERIYEEVAKSLAAVVNDLPAIQKHTAAGFDEESMDELLTIADSYDPSGRATIYCTLEFASKMIPAEGWRSNGMKDRMWEMGYLGDYKGHSVVLLPQSMADETNTTKVVDPSYAYIIPGGTEKPVKIVFEGQTQVRTVQNQNDDWSTDLQCYRKVGVLTIAPNWMCSYQNTDLVMATRPNL